MPAKEGREVRIARVFRNGRNQAIRIPVELSLDADEVTIERRGDGLLIRPRRSAGWDCFFADDQTRLPDEFAIPEDPPPTERESL